MAAKIRTQGPRMLAAIILTVCLALALTGCGTGKEISSSGQGQQRTIVDMAGRTVNIPAKVQRVYATSPVGTILTYTVDPNKLAAWNYYMPVRDSRYILPECRDLPIIGGWLGNNNFGNLEDILKLQPDIILHTTVPGRPDKVLADTIQQRTNIPVVVVDGSTDSMDKAYEFTGKLLEQEARGRTLGEYCRATLRDIQEKRGKVAHRKKVYYAEGIKGLETEPKGSWHTEAIEMVGENVAGTEIGQGGPIGRAQVSLEQVMVWAPEVILVCYFPEGESSCYENILTDSKWQDLKAVAGKQVYEVPASPFNWLDRPPSVNRLIGIKWVANLLYPEVYTYDMPAEVKRFYELFYHYKLTDQETAELLKRASRQ